MSPRKILVNSFVAVKAVKEKVTIDPVSKYLIKFQAFFGLNRLRLLNEYSFTHLTIILILQFLLIVSISAYTFYNVHGNYESSIEDFILLLSYLFCAIFCLISCKKFKYFFKEVNSFDKAVGSEVKIRECIKQNFPLHAIMAVVLLSEIFVFTYRLVTSDSFLIKWHLLPIRMINLSEFYLYGNLFSLLCPRITLLNSFMETSISKDQNVNIERKHKFEFSNTPNYRLEIKYLMGLYEIIIAAHEKLVDAIKWLILVIIVMSFIATIKSTYSLSTQIFAIRAGKSSTYDLKIYLHVMSLLGRTLSLFVPCLYEAQLTSHVLTLRMLLSARLYENKMDKESRGVARAFLKLTEEQDLSFSLFGMVDVDISLPLNYISLLVTYLIILLQFYKVIHS